MCEEVVVERGKRGRASFIVHLDLTPHLWSTSVFITPTPSSQPSKHPIIQPPSQKLLRQHTLLMPPLRPPTLHAPLTRHTIPIRLLRKSHITRIRMIQTRHALLRRYTLELGLVLMLVAGAFTA